MGKAHISLIENGFAVIEDMNMNRWNTVAIFDSWINANNFMLKNLGERRGRIVSVKELQGTVEEKDVSV